jgi:hypothetical protein
MNISKLGINKKKATVILGAGATRGASCFEGSWLDAPLDTDFFEILEKVAARDQQGILQKYLEAAKAEFNNIYSYRMESFFTEVESLDTFHDTLNIKRGARLKKYQKILADYPKMLAQLFTVLKNETKSKSLTCDYHDKLAEQFTPGDTIVSFNYDCIIDEALKRSSGKRWLAKKGYGVNIQGGLTRWQDHSGSGALTKDSIKLLKVHGSLNWDYSSKSLVLRQDPYEVRNRTAKDIVPPVWNKRIQDSQELMAIWRQARIGLGGMPVLISIGYSIPETDLLSKSMLRVAPSEATKPLTHLILINPDKNVRIKHVETLGKAVGPGTQVVEFSYFSQFADILS